MIPQTFPLPLPKTTIRQEGYYRLGLRTRIVLDDGAAEGERMAAEWLTQALETSHRFHCDLAGASQAEQLKDSILFVDTSRPAAWARWLPGLGVKENLGPESFWLRVTKDGAVIAGGGPWAVFYGGQALSACLESVEGRPALPCLEAWDAPEFSVRGIHISLSISGADLGFVWRILGEMTRARMNTLFLQVNRSLRYESFPELAAEKAFSKVEFQGVLDFARGYGIQVIPQLDLLTRQEDFLLAARPDLAENLEAPFSYCPSRPEVYKILDGVCQELLELFQPKYFHVGHADLNPPKAACLVGVCTRCKRFPPQEVIAKDMEHWGELLQSRDVIPIAWAARWMEEGTEPFLQRGKGPRCGLLPCVEPGEWGEGWVERFVEGSEVGEAGWRVGAAHHGMFVVSQERGRLVRACREARKLPGGCRGMVLWTGAAANELEFGRLGILQAIPASGHLFWNPAIELREQPKTLSGLILRI